MFNSINNIAFKSNIRFVSDNEFGSITNHLERLRNNSKYIGSPWNRVIKSDEGLTESIQGCNAGGITDLNSNDVAFFHYQTINDKNIEEDISQAVESLNGQKQSESNKKGLLTGGQIAKSYSCFSGPSETLRLQLESIFEKLKVDYSTFWGQATLGAKTNLYYSKYFDTWFINYQDKDKSCDPNLIKNPYDIKEAYFYTDIAKEDQVFIGAKSQTEVDKIDLYHEFKKIDGGYELDYSYRNPYEQSRFNFTPPVDTGKKVKIYPGNFGQDRSVLWIDSNKKDDIKAVLENIGKIKQGNMFKDVNKLQYAGKETMPGFNEIYINGQKVFEKNLNSNLF